MASPPSSKGTPIQDTLSDFLQSLLPSDSKLLTHLPKSMRRSARWITIGMGTTCLLAWNSRLVLSTGAGIGMLLLAYSMRETAWRAAITDLVNLLESLNQRIVLSVLSGAGATLGTYLILSIWLETQNHWLATGMILQGAATIGTLGLLLWQNWAKLQQSTSPKQLDWSHCLADLTHADPLKRLIAIRQINQQIPDRPSEQADIADYYRILLSRETDKIIQSALLDGLQNLSQNQSLKNFRKNSRTPRSQQDPSLRQTILPQAAEPAFSPRVEAWSERPVKELVENFEHN